MSMAQFCASYEHDGYTDLKNLTPAEVELIKDGLAALLAALPQGHTLRTDVASLITCLKGDS